MTTVLGDRPLQFDHQRLCSALISATRAAAAQTTDRLRPAMGGEGVFEALTRTNCRVLESLVAHLYSDLSNARPHPASLHVASILTSLVWVPLALTDGSSSHGMHGDSTARCGVKIVRRLESVLANCLHVILTKHGAIRSDASRTNSTAAPWEGLALSTLSVIAQYRVPRMFQQRDVDIFECIVEYLLDHGSTSADAPFRELAFRSILNLVRRELLPIGSWCSCFIDMTALTLAELNYSAVSFTSGPAKGQLTTAIRTVELVDLLRGLATRDDCWHLLPVVFARCTTIMSIVRYFVTSYRLRCQDHTAYVSRRSEGMRVLSANKHLGRNSSSSDASFEASGRLCTRLWCLWSELCMRIRRQRQPSLLERPRTPVSRQAQLHADPDPSTMATWMNGSCCSIDDYRLVLSGAGSLQAANQLLLALYAPAKGIGTPSCISTYCIDYSLSCHSRETKLLL